MTPEQAWQATINQLQMEMPKATFDTWVREARFLAFTEGTITIGLENAYARDWVESRLTSTMSRVLAGILNQPVKLDFVAQPRIREEARPEAAWETVFDHLQRSASPINFERYLKYARFLAYYGNNFIIGLPTNEARNWVEETVNGTASHMLTSMMHQPVDVKFVVAPNQEEEKFENQAGSEGEEDEIPNVKLSNAAAEILIKPVCASLRETIVRSNKVVIVPAYLLRWLPYLGPDKGWFLIAMRQAFFQAYGKKVSPAHCGQTFTVNRKRLSRWAGMGEGLVRQFLGELEGPNEGGNFLAWFMQSFPNGRGNPKAYAFRADMPLTPGDAEALHLWLLENGIREKPLETLKLALERQPRELLPYPPPPPAEHHLTLKPEPHTVQEVVIVASGMAKAHLEYLPLKKLANQLQQHLQSPADNLLLTHYFLLEWLPILGRTPAWVITILRDRGFIDHNTGVRRDRIKLAGGYGELAQLLNVSERQIRDWLPALESMVHRGGQSPDEAALDSHWGKRQAKRSLVGYFLEKSGVIDRSGNQETSYEFKVKLEEPLTPEHQEIYEAMEQFLHDCTVVGEVAELEGLTVELETLVRERSNPIETRYANDPTSSHVGTRMIQLPVTSVRESSNPRSANDPGSGEVGARKIHLKALLIKHLYPKALLEIKQLLQQHLAELRTGETVETEPDGVGGEEDLIWNWEKLLGYGGLSAKTRAEILQSPEKQTHFLGQVLYGFENKTTEEGKGIKSPFKYAEKHRHERPLPEYIELASLLPDELGAVLKDWQRYGPACSISDSAFRVARALWEHEFLRVIEDATEIQTLDSGP